MEWWGKGRDLFHLFLSWELWAQRKLQCSGTHLAPWHRPWSSLSFVQAVLVQCILTRAGILYSSWITSFSHHLPVPHPRQQLLFKGNKNYIILKPQIIQLRLFKTATNASRYYSSLNIPHGNIIQELEKCTGSFFWEGPHGNLHLPSSACLLSHLPLSSKSYFSNLKQLRWKGLGFCASQGEKWIFFPYAKGEQNAKFHSKAAPAQLHLTSKWAFMESQKGLGLERIWKLIQFHGLGNSTVPGCSKLVLGKLGNPGNPSHPPREKIPSQIPQKSHLSLPSVPLIHSLMPCHKVLSQIFVNLLFGALNTEPNRTQIFHFERKNPFPRALCFAFKFLYLLSSEKRTKDSKSCQMCTSPLVLLLLLGCCMWNENIFKTRSVWMWEICKEKPS